MVKRFSEVQFPVLSSAINSVNKKLTCPKFREISEFLEVDIWDNIKNLKPFFAEVAEKGFGFSSCQFREHWEVKKIIVFNIDNMFRARLSEDEIMAILYHELGHLLNFPNLFVVPTMAVCMEYAIEYSKEKEEATRIENAILMETYADSYATQHGYGPALISTFDKQNHFFKQQMNYYQIRVQKITEKEKLIGWIMPEDAAGW